MTSRPPQLVLASRSPRRAEYLRQIGFDFEASSGDCDESWHEGESAEDYVRRIAETKASVCDFRVPEDSEAVILAADTTVWRPDSSDAPLGKPSDWEQARDMLELLFGTEHRVSTAMCLEHRKAEAQPSRETIVASTRVWMRRPSPAELDCYRASQEWTDKAGAYGIQGYASAFVTRIEGSYSSVVGLPLAECVELLGNWGIRPTADLPGGSF